MHDKIDDVIEHVDLSEAIQETNPVIVNIVATFSLATEISLKELVLKARNIEFNPKRFQGAVMRLRGPKSTTILFRTGKVVIVGVRKETDLQLVAQKVENIVRKIGYENATVQDLTIQNMTVTGRAPFKFRLEGILSQYSRFCSFEPELFPGLYFRMIDPKLCFILFISGKIVVCGAKSLEAVHTGLQKLYPVLQQFKVRQQIQVI